MILSNSAILAALDDGRLVIEPQPNPREPGQVGGDWPYSTSALDLRLGSEISWLNDGLPLAIDLRRGGFAKLFGPNSSRRTITEDQPFRLNPQKFVLANTLERVELPIVAERPSLAARVEGKSSYARCGLLVHFTAPTVHSGFAGQITLEIINLGPVAIDLFPGMYICQLILEEVVGTPIRNDSQFQGQTRPHGA